MKIEAELKEFKEKLDIRLAEFFDQKINIASSVDPEAKKLVEHIKDLTLRGGKRIRAALLYYSYVAHGGKELDRAMNAAMAMEISETFLLIHDDVIDNDEMRRGGKTLHTIYENVCKDDYKNKHLDPKQFGHACAIMAGDAAYAFANDLIATAGFGANNTVRAITELSRIIEREVYGEILDVLIEIKNNPTREDVFKVQQLKTAPYTFDSPVKLGAILADAKRQQIKALESYTIPLGIAFQIQDDILGIFGSQDKTGKPILSDLKEGKITLLIIDTLETASAEQRALIAKNLGNKDITLDNLKAVKKVIVETGALKKSQAVARSLAQSGYEALQKLKLKSDGADFMLGIIDYIVNREF